MRASGRPAPFLVGSLIAALVVADLALGVRPGHAADQDFRRFRVSGGFDYSSGDYGSGQSTRILSFPYSARAERGRWRFKLSVPFIRIDGPGTVVGGPDGGVVIGADGGRPRTIQSGLGDVVVSVSRRLGRLAGWLPYLDVTAKVKLPTANRDEGLGTGRADYSLQADAFTRFGKLTPFATLGYRITGDLPTLPLKDTIYASGGLGYRLSRQWRSGFVVDFRQASTARSRKRLALVPYVTWKLTRKWAINLYGVAGLADGSPDAGGGIQLSLTR